MQLALSAVEQHVDDQTRMLPTGGGIREAERSPIVLHYRCPKLHFHIFSLALKLILGNKDFIFLMFAFFFL